MISPRRAEERAHVGGGPRERWLTFRPASEASKRPAESFGALCSLDDLRLGPGAAMSLRAPRDAEMMTYVLEGAIAVGDAKGGTTLLRAGEFQQSLVARGAAAEVRNASRAQSAVVFRLAVRGPRWAERAPQAAKRFTLGERRAELCAVASPDGRRGSLLTQEDFVLYSAVLGSGQHIVHELADGRDAWLHVISGEIAAGDVVLTDGDGVGLTGERTASFTARVEAEILLIDVWGRVAAAAA